MITIHLHRSGQTEQATSIDRAWLGPGSGVFLWVDLASPSIPESLILSDTFAFHPLSVEDAMSGRQSPKVEAYDGYLYVILHGLDSQPSGRGLGTKPAPAVVRDILAARRDVASLRRVLALQRDAVARLARRDSVDISTEMSFRFRDLHDHLVRLTDDAALFDDRLAGILHVGAAAAFGRKHWI